LFYKQLIRISPLLMCATALAADPVKLPAFPGAEGFGALATGGRGGEIVHVTTLADKGPGSLRDAVSKPNRFVVFDVAGVIKLDSNVDVLDNITLAGQTAPGDGIAIYNRTVSVSTHKNIIIRYLRFREGIAGDRGKCAINCSTGSNMIFDHCSIQWGRWDCLGCTVNSHDITFQYCAIGEGLDPQRFGALVDTVENVTISHNLWVSNQSRNPKAKGTIQYINNVVYNYGGTGLAGGHSSADHQLDVINNYLIAGPSSSGHAIAGFSSSDKVFDSGNLVDLNKDGKLNGRPVTHADYNDPTGGADDGDGEAKGAGGTGGVVIPTGQNSYPTFVAKSWSEGKPPIAVTVDSAVDAFKKVSAGAGASIHRDPVDTRLFAELASLGTKGKIIKDEAESGGIGTIKPATAAVDTDHDGIPDEWEKAHGLDPSNADDAKSLNKDGYMMIEVYANELAAQQK
jgi:pectate lyase